LQALQFAANPKPNRAPPVLDNNEKITGIEDITADVKCSSSKNEII